jgi:hypothetical protein
MVDDVQTGEGRVEGVRVPVLIDGDMQILEGETALYSDELYTLHLEDKRRRDCDFYSDPIDIVESRYHMEGSGELHESSYWRTST